MSADNFVYSKFKVKVDIEGTVFEDEVVAVSATYALNDIPTATAVIACGMNMRTMQPSKIHNALNTLLPRMKATIDVTIETPFGRTWKSPSGTHRVFEGFYVGIGIQRSDTNANYILHFVHWLDDLNCGSILNGNWYPGTPADMAQTALYGSLANNPGSGLGAPVPFADPYLTLITKDNMETDLWGSVLKPALLGLSKRKHPITQGTCLGNDNNNKVVEDGLNKMPDGAPTALPLSMDLPNVDSALLSVNAQSGISKMLTNGLAYNTIWSKLVGELAASFLFAVSPGATFATVIPFFGGLRISADGTAWRTIRLNDYNYANFNSSQRQLLESISVFYPFVSNSNLGGGREAAAPSISQCPPVAKYPPVPTSRKGVIMVRELPTWLHNCTSVGGYAHEALYPEVDTHSPGQGSSTPTGSVTIRPPLTIEREKGVASRYCEHWYKTEILNQRYGELSGKLRFDIAPGSMIAIEVPPAPPPVNPLSGGGEPSHMYASVTKVSFVINAEQHSAGTSLVLSNLRTEAENNDALLTNEKPPLYQTPWYGGPLTKEATGDNILR